MNLANNNGWFYNCCSNQTKELMSIGHQAFSICVFVTKQVFPQFAFKQKMIQNFIKHMLRVWNQ